MPNNTEFKGIIAPEKESRILSRVSTTPELSDESNQLDGILAYKTTDHKILHCNENFLRYIGYKNVNTLIGKTDHDLIWQEYTDIYHGQENDAISNQVYSALHPGKDVNGRNFLFFNRKYPWTDKHGKIIGLVSYSIEIENSNLIELGHLLKKTDVSNSRGIHFLDKQRSTFGLSQREAECLFYMVRGKTVKKIAEILGISDRTVETYTERLKNKFNCHSKSDLIEVAIKIGFVNVVPNSIFSTKLLDSLKD